MCVVVVVVVAILLISNAPTVAALVVVSCLQKFLRYALCFPNHLHSLKVLLTQIAAVCCAFLKLAQHVLGLCVTADQEGIPQNIRPAVHLMKNDQRYTQETAEGRAVIMLIRDNRGRDFFALLPWNFGFCIIKHKNSTYDLDEQTQEGTLIEVVDAVDAAAP